MKNMTQGLQRGTMAAALGLAVGYFLFGTRDASTPTMSAAATQSSAVAETAVWEYNTTSIDAASLQGMLTTLGVNGWEVFSITATDATVDNKTDGKAHVTTQRFEVTSKRKHPR